MNRIIINKQEIYVSDIASENYSYVPQSDFEGRVLKFVQKWFETEAVFEASTSGSTGIPKMMKIPKESLMLSAEMTAKAVDLKPGMTALLAMDPKHIGGMMMIARALTLEMDLWVAEPSSNPLNQIPENITIDFTAFVPLQMSKILEEGADNRLERIKVILVGGGPVSKKLESKITSLQTSIYQTYGMTETLSHIALKKLNGSEKSSFYRTLPGIKITQDDRGCLKISGAFLKEEVVTNDIVEITNPDTFNWLGRYDNIINSGGIKLNPELIEPVIFDVLNENNFGDHRFFLAGIQDEEFGEKMILFVEGDLKGMIEHLLQRLKQNLDTYQCPKSIVEIKEFAMTETGKIKRKEIIQKFLGTM